MDLMNKINALLLTDTGYSFRFLAIKEEHSLGNSTFYFCIP